MEQGPNVFIERPHLMSLIRDLGLESQIRYPVIERYKQYVWWNGAPHVVPKGPLQFVMSRLFSFTEKCRIISAARTPGILAPQGEDESVATFFGRLIGRNGTERVLDPVLKGIYGGEVDVLSARSIFPSLWQEAQKGASMMGIMKSKKGKGIKPKIFTLEGGNARLVERILEALPQERLKSEKVEALEPSEHGFRVRTGRGEVEAREVYIATSGQATAGYLRSLDDHLCESLNTLSYSPIVVVHCACPASVPLPSDGFGVLFSKEESGLLGIMFNSRLFPHMAPTGKHLLTLCFGGAAHKEIGQCSDQELSARVTRELSSKLGIAENEVLQITRWPSAIPQYGLHHFRTVQQMEELEERHKGLHFIGVDRGGVGVPDRVRSGVSLGKSE